MRVLFLLFGKITEEKLDFIPFKYRENIIFNHKLNLLINGQKLDIKGNITNNTNHKKLNDFLKLVLKEKMTKGETIFLNLFKNNKIFNKNIDILKQIYFYVKSFNYYPVILNFNNSNLNKVIKEIFFDYDYKIYNVNNLNYDFNQIENFLIDKFTFKIPSGYGNLFVIGDLHGMYKEYLKLKEHIDFDNDFVIFLGDYFDRFPSEEELILLFKDLYELSKKENVVFIKGNHEEYKINLETFFKDFKLLKSFEENKNKKNKEKNENYNVVKILKTKLKNKKLKIGYTKSKTLEIILKNNLENQFLDFIKKLKLFYFIKNKNKYIYLNHGGVSVPINSRNFLFLTDEQFLLGSGRKGDEVELANIFSKNFPNVYQFFGHRNVGNTGPKLAGGVYTLNGTADHGYDIRGLKYNLVKNKVENVYQVFRNEVRNE